MSPYACDDAHSGIQCDDRATAIADKREGQTDNRHNEQAHSDIFYRLKNQHRTKSHTNQATHTTFRNLRCLEAPPDQQKFQDDNDKATNHAQFLATDRENKVRLSFG